MPTEGSNPHIGTIQKQEFIKEVRAEVLFPSYLEAKIIQALRKAHPYEEVAFYINTLSNENQEVGSGMVGELPEPLEPMIFLQRLKETMNLSVIRYTQPLDRKVKKVAVCGGSGSFLLSQARQAGADVLVTADFKYHEFFDADGQIMIADIGHYESEIFTKELIIELLKEKFPTFAVNFSTTDTNPIRYL
jgi:putative NIF3 family GTP cyclohydrolase 1 type 2